MSLALVTAYSAVAVLIVSELAPTAVTVPDRSRWWPPWCSCASGTPSAPLSPGCGSAAVLELLERLELLGLGVDVAADAPTGWPARRRQPALPRPG